MTERDVRVAASPETLAEVAQVVALEALGEAVAARGAARVVLAGGATPHRLYRLLVVASRALDWSRVSFFWGDERVVPPKDPASNYRSACATLLEPLAIRPERRMRIKGELTAERAAAEYDLTVAAALADGPWDLVLLGLGSDGHTASLFPPRMPAATAGWVCATVAPVAPTARVSMTVEALSRSRRTLFLVSGASKAEAVRRVLADEATLHASAIAAGSPAVSWCLDRAAASALAVGSLQSVVEP